jgi:twinkle protein
MFREDVPSDVKFLADKLSVGQYKRKCPQCHHTRSKHKHDRALSLNIDTDGVRYHCHHCGIQGGWMHKKNTYTPDPFERKSITLPDRSEPNAVAKEYLVSRNIAEEVIEKHTVQGTYTFNGKAVPAIGFLYEDEHGVQAIKWRSANKAKYYSQQNVCEDFYNLHNYKTGNDILLVEGEMDALSWMSCDIPENLTVMSIPNGAPSKVRDGKVDPREDKKFQYVWRAKDQLESAERIILCFDNDEAGGALQEEIRRRIGTSKLWTLDLGGYKDTSEALQDKGVGYLLGQLEVADPYPTVGLYRARDFKRDYDQLYEEGQISGSSTGLRSLDQLIQVVPGMLTVVTGFPSSGKSDLIDQICLNLARQEGLKTVYCSFEKPPALHMAQLAQKLMDKPFFEGISTRMAHEAKDYAYEWIDEHFLFMDHTLDGPTTIDGILDTASAAVMQIGCRLLVIDPYNFIELPPSDRETDSISKMLTKIQKWAKSHDVHVFFIAHPTKLSPDRRSDKKVVITGHDIAGSAAWFAKADLGITAWRHQRDEEPPECHVWKVRWGWIGTNGYCQLDFDRATGRWTDHIREEVDDARWDF